MHSRLSLNHPSMHAAIHPSSFHRLNDELVIEDETQKDGAYSELIEGIFVPLIVEL